jgi:hypothetical protein
VKHPARMLFFASVALVGVTLTLVGAQGMDAERPHYADWTRLNPQKNFIQSAHPEAKDVYVNEAGSDAALSRSFPFPEGSQLVKESIDTETLEVFVITSMRKVAGFDPDNGDWQYGMFERGDDGTFSGMWAEVGSEMHTMCVTCHTNAADNDFAFLTYTGD